MKKKFQNNLAEIQYWGLSGVTKQCLESIVRSIHYGDIIHEAKLISCRESDCAYHGFILNINDDEIVGIKSGFSSGYLGTGSKGLAKALQLLMFHGTDIKEYEVTKDFIDRLDKSCLLTSDLEFLNDANYIRPDRYADYIFDVGDSASLSLGDKVDLLNEFPLSIPFSLIDPRIIDLAINFFDNPDAKILTAFRRLEEIVKTRTNITDKFGSKLFLAAFQGDESPLYWKDEEKSEQAAKANLFSAIYGSYRNPRAHREVYSDNDGYLREFLLVNELFILEKAAIERTNMIEPTELAASIIKFIK